MRMRVAQWFAVLSLILAHTAAAQPWPAKPIRLIVTFPPGGTSDIVARLVGERLGARLGQPVVIDNRPGVAGILGTEAAVSAPADGYTLLLTSIAPIAFAPSTPKPLSYDPLKQLAHVAIIGTIPLAFVVRLDLAGEERARGRRACEGQARCPQFQLERQCHAQPLHARALQAERRGPDHARAVQGLGTGAERHHGRPHRWHDRLHAGGARADTRRKVRALAVSGSERAPQLPDVPTLAEAGFPDLVVNTWFGIAAPAATPGEIVQRAQPGSARQSCSRRT